MNNYNDSIEKYLAWLDKIKKQNGGLKWTKIINS
jgi:hypothetical protein